MCFLLYYLTFDLSNKIYGGDKMEYIVKTNKLTKRFIDKVAVNEVSMNITQGDIYGFIGRNGAGKTTTMKLLLGMIYPTSGSMELFGSKDLEKQRIKIGSLIEAPGIYKNCTAFENMKRFSLISGGSDKEITNLLEFVGLGNVGNKKAGDFSLGMRQRLGIAIAMLGNPELLVLDEPINGLDPAGIKDIRDLILKINKERKVTVLVSSHLLDELSKIVTKYGIVNNGRLVEEITAEELNNRCKEYLSIKVDNLKLAHSLLSKTYSNIEIEIKGEYINIYSHLDKSDEMNKLLVTNNVKVYELAFAKGGLEEYFIERIG